MRRFNSRLLNAVTFNIDKTHTLTCRVQGLGHRNCIGTIAKRSYVDYRNDRVIGLLGLRIGYDSLLPEKSGFGVVADDITIC